MSHRVGLGRHAAVWLTHEVHVLYFYYTSNTVLFVPCDYGRVLANPFSLIIFVTVLPTTLHSASHYEIHDGNGW